MAEVLGIVQKASVDKMTVSYCTHYKYSWAVLQCILSCEEVHLVLVSSLFWIYKIEYINHCIYISNN